MTDDPQAPDGIDTEGKAVPPYEGRRETADVRGEEAATRQGVRVGGATGPVENDTMSAPDPGDTPGGATGSPADEQPAGGAASTGTDDEGVGPAHTAGTPRAEDQS
jgi:hypothetical protein